MAEVPGGGATEVDLRRGDPRRVVTAAVACLALGVVLVVVGVLTASAFDPTTLLGVAVTVAGLVLVARLPAALDRSVVAVRDHGLDWSGVGAADWSVPWSEVAQVRLVPGRRAASLLVALPEGDVVLPCRPAALPDLYAALARHAPGVPVVEGSAR